MGRNGAPQAKTRRQRTVLLGVLLCGWHLAALSDDTGSTQRWTADPATSKLGFTATQEGAEFSGVFTEFSSGLELQAAHDTLVLQQLTAIIQLGSVDTQYQDRDDYLAQEDWFHIKVWPDAKFTSEQITDQGNGNYTATGPLTLRGVSQPVTLQLQLTIDEGDERGTLTGTATLNRLDFGVGRGDWENTEWVGADVNVSFELSLLRAFE